MPPASSVPLFQRTLTQIIIMWILYFTPKFLKIKLYAYAKSWCKKHKRIPHRAIHRLPFGLLLKTAVWGSANEAAAMQMAEKLGINSTRLIDQVAAGPEEMYLLTTWVPGTPFNEAWKDVTPEDKTMFVEQLRAEIHKMREQTATDSHIICHADGSVVHDPRLPWVTREDPRVFTSCREFFEQVWINLDDKPRYGGPLRPAIQPLIDRTDRAIVFTHGDILARNIVIPGGLEEWRKKRSKICLIDWQNAGWFPLEWDAVKATTLCLGRNAWFKLMLEVFPESRAEIEGEEEWQDRGWTVAV